MKGWLIALVVLLPTVAGPGEAAAAVDPALVGTWKLEWARADLFWAVRPDGVYRIHGPGATARQVGRLEASRGRFVMKSALWADQGPYRLVDAGTWIVTGQLGPGTWKRVWTPGQGDASQPSGPGACGLVSAAEVAQVLRAPVTGGPDVRAGDGGCTFRSLLGGLDQLSIKIRTNQGSFFQNHRKNKADRTVDVPGVGDQAYAEGHPAGGPLGSLLLLKRDAWVTISVGLHPPATLDDLPYLTELARALARRL